MENKPCNKCLCCLNLPDCADFWEISGMPAPDYGCNELLQEPSDVRAV